MEGLSPSSRPDPWKLVGWIAKATTFLGVLSILHLISEAVQLLIWGHGVETLYFITFLLEIPIPLMWLQSGRSLRERKDWALLITVTTASIALADAVVVGILMGPSMMKFAADHLIDFDIRTGIFGARILAYATQALCAPLVLAISLRDHHRRGLIEVYGRYSRTDLWFAFAMATVADSLLKTLIIVSLTRDA